MKKGIWTILSAKTYVQNVLLIGSANWVNALSRLYVTYARNMLARYLMASCEGHLMIALKQLLGYLRKHPDGQILIDPNPMDHSEGLKKFTAYDN